MDYNKKILKIAQIAPINLPVPTNYGGVERIISDLTLGLRKKGHEVTVYASGDSTIKGKKSFFKKHVKGNYMQDTNAIFSHLTHISLSLNDALLHSDIIHCHIAFLPLFFTRYLSKPLVITFHNPIAVEHREREDILRDLDYKYLTSISLNQQKSVPWLRFYSNVYDGVDIKTFNIGQEKTDRKNFLWVGRFEVIKGPKIAIMAAIRAGVKLIMIGPRSFGDSVFNKTIKPYLKNKIFYSGEKSKGKLPPYYQNAKAVLLPIKWEEPFGLVMIEAMACGTPVIAFARGSVPEVVKDGQTGFIVNSSESDKRGNWIIKKTGIAGLVEAIKKIDSMPQLEYEQMRHNCRWHVEKKFTIEKMVDGYEKVYKKLIELNKRKKIEL